MGVLGQAPSSGPPIAEGRGGQSHFGEVALAGEPLLWLLMRITTVEDLRVSFLRAAIFQELCCEYPELAMELCRLLARRLREAGEAVPP